MRSHKKRGLKLLKEDMKHIYLSTEDALNHKIWQSKIKIVDPTLQDEAGQFSFMFVPYFYKYQNQLMLICHTFLRKFSIPQFIDYFKRIEIWKSTRVNSSSTVCLLHSRGVKVFVKQLLTDGLSPLILIESLMSCRANYQSINLIFGQKVILSPYKRLHYINLPLEGHPWQPKNQFY